MNDFRATARRILETSTDWVVDSTTVAASPTNRQDCRFVQRSCPKGEAQGCAEQHLALSAIFAA
jgi:hypothetical protein